MIQRWWLQQIYGRMQYGVQHNT